MNAAQKAIAKKNQDQALARSLVANPMLDPSADSSTVIRYMVAKVDEAAVAMERKWGRGTFPQLAGELMAAKFESQQRKLDDAIQAGMCAEVIKHGEAMVRAWAAVEQAAINMGKQPRPVVAFSAPLDGGGTLYVVESQEDTARITERGAVVMSVAEVAALLSRDELGRLVVGVKKVFEDATVVKGPVDFVTGDDIPF
jgi:hypothetical protein